MNPCPTQPSPITPSRRFPATAGLRLNCRVMSIGYIAIDPTLVECWDHELRGRRRHHGGRDLRRRDVDSRAVAPAACLWGRSLAEAQGQRPSAPRGWFGLPRRGPLVRGSRDRPRLGGQTSSLGGQTLFLVFHPRRETKNKVSCIGLVYTAPVDPSLKAVSLSTAGPEKVSSDSPLGDSCIGLVYTAPVHPSLKAVSLSTAGPEKVSSDGPLGD